MSKRNVLIPVFLVAFFAAAQAQKLSFCEALPMLEKNATEAFVDIKKEADNAVKYPKTYFSSIQISEAISSRIVEHTNGYRFKADLGTFSSKAEALQKMNTLQAAIKKCYPGINTTYSTDILKISDYYTCYNLGEKSFRLYSARFKLMTLGGKTDLTFEFDSDETDPDFDIPPQKAYYDFGIIESSLSYDEFSVALRKVIEEAKTGFKAIMGAETDYGRGFTCYRTKLFIPGFSSFIEDRTLGIVFYIIPTFQKATAENFVQTAEKAQKMIQSALGNSYGYRTSEDGKNQIYVHKDQPDKTVVEILLNEKNGEFIFELYIKSLE